MLKVKVVIENENNMRVGEKKTFLRVKIRQETWVADTADTATSGLTWLAATATSDRRLR